MVRAGMLPAIAFFVAPDTNNSGLPLWQQVPLTILGVGIAFGLIFGLLGLLYGAQGVTAPSMVGVGLDPGAVDGGRDADAGADRHGVAIPHHGRERLPVRYVRQPVGKTALQ